MPLLGTAIGFIVGIGVYYLVDWAAGEDVEHSVRELGGEQGCVGGSR